MKHLSICISAYEMGGKGAEYLRFNFDIFLRQTFKDFEVVVSDQSKDGAIKAVCDEYRDRLDIRYVQNRDYGSGSANTNTAIQNARGKLIKILFLDDFLYKETSLETIVKAFDLEKDNWLVTACLSSYDGVRFFRPFYPVYDPATILFRNRISCPSVLTMKNEDPLLFDVNLLWSMDLDYYKRMGDRFGPPKIVEDLNVVNRVGPHQSTNTTQTEDRRETEYKYILKKYRIPNARKLLVIYKLKRYKRRIGGIVKKALNISTR